MTVTVIVKDSLSCDLGSFSYHCLAVYQSMALHNLFWPCHSRFLAWSWSDVWTCLRCLFSRSMQSSCFEFFWGCLLHRGRSFQVSHLAILQATSISKLYATAVRSISVCNLQSIQDSQQSAFWQLCSLQVRLHSFYFWDKGISTRRLCIGRRRGWLRMIAPFQ